MRSVFALSPGQTGVAANQPKTMVYVVRVVSQVPDDSTLKEQFLETGGNPQSRQMMEFVASRDLFEVAREMFQQVNERYDLEWQRPPAPGSSSF